VDDVVIATNKSHTMSNFKSYLHGKFQMTDLREIRHFIGIKIDKTNGEICLSQSAYLKNVLAKFYMEECNSVSTPLPSNLDYTALQSEESCDAPCRNLIGCVMYIMLCTRPDLSTSISILNRYTNNK